MSREAERKPLTKKQREAIRKKKRQRKIMLVVLEILVLLLLAIVLFIVVKFSKIEKDSSFNQDDIEINEGLSQESKEIMENYTTIALFGLDNRSNGNLSKGNSDVIMIASINNDTHGVKLVSVYRDSYLDIGNNTYRKCNSAYANGGPEQAICIFGGRFIVSWFVSNPSEEIFTYAMQYLTVASWFFLPLAMIFLYRNALQGLNEGLIPMLSGIIEMICRIAVIVLVPAGTGFFGVCFADPAAWVGAGIPLLITYLIWEKRTKQRLIASHD